MNRLLKYKDERKKRDAFIKSTRIRLLKFLSFVFFVMLIFFTSLVIYVTWDYCYEHYYANWFKWIKYLFTISAQIPDTPLSSKYLMKFIIWLKDVFIFCYNYIFFVQPLTNLLNYLGFGVSDIFPTDELRRVFDFVSDIIGLDYKLRQILRMYTEFKNSLQYIFQSIWYFLRYRVFNDYIFYYLFRRRLWLPNYKKYKEEEAEYSESHRESKRRKEAEEKIREELRKKWEYTPDSSDEFGLFVLNSIRRMIRIFFNLDKIFDEDAKQNQSYAHYQKVKEDERAEEDKQRKSKEQVHDSPPYNFSSDNSYDWQQVTKEFSSDFAEFLKTNQKEYIKPDDDPRPSVVQWLSYFYEKLPKSSSRTLEEEYKFHKNMADVLMSSSIKSFRERGLYHYQMAEWTKLRIYMVKEGVAPRPFSFEKVYKDLPYRKIQDSQEWWENFGYGISELGPLTKNLSGFLYYYFVKEPIRRWDDNTPDWALAHRFKRKRFFNRIFDYIYRDYRYHHPDDPEVKAKTDPSAAPKFSRGNFHNTDPIIDFELERRQKPTGFFKKLLRIFMGPSYYDPVVRKEQEEEAINFDSGERKQEENPLLKQEPSYNPFWL